MENVTVDEALKITFIELRKVFVPAEYSESIGMPIYRALMTLNKCINALVEARHQEEAKQQEAAAHEAPAEEATAEET